MYKHRKNTLTQHQSNARKYVKTKTKQIKTNKASSKQSTFAFKLAQTVTALQ